MKNASEISEWSKGIEKKYRLSDKVSGAEYRAIANIVALAGIFGEDTIQQMLNDVVETLSTPEMKERVKEIRESGEGFA